MKKLAKLGKVLKKAIPSTTDVLFISGLGSLGTGISYHWSWPLALVVIGGILLSLAIIAKLKGID